MDDDGFIWIYGLYGLWTMDGLQYHKIHKSSYFWFMDLYELIWIYGL